MTAKEYLEQAYWLDQQISSKLEQVEALRAMATKTTFIMQKDVVSRSRNMHSMEDTIAKIADMEENINEDVERLVDLKREITEIIDEVAAPELKMLLVMRYLGYKKWEEIADSLHRADRSMQRIHQRALKAVEEIMIRKGIRQNEDKSTEQD